jgi:hypothetical protein
VAAYLKVCSTWHCHKDFSFVFWKLFHFILKETYDSLGWQHRWCQRVYGRNSLAFGHLVKSSFFPRVSSTHLTPHFILVFVFASNDSFAAGGPPPAPPTFLLLFLLYLLFSFQFHSLLIVPSPWSITPTPTASSYYSNLINLILSLFIPWSFGSP